MKALLLTMAVGTALFAAACGGDSGSETAAQESGAAAAAGEASAPKTEPTVTVPAGEPPSQLQVEDLEGGTGRAAKAGDEVTVQYVGVGYESEEGFDSSWSRNEPFSFVLGGREVIPGWERGIEGMKVGGRRELIIPPSLAYGSAGAPPAIGPSETLIFVVDLLEVG